jgi:hypothetical protein
MELVDGIVLPVASCGTALSDVSGQESFTKPLLCRLSYASLADSRIPERRQQAFNAMLIVLQSEPQKDLASETFIRLITVRSGSNLSC